MASLAALRRQGVVSGFGHLADLTQQADHFQRRQGGFCALVTRLGTGTLHGLFNGVHGQYAKGDRQTVVQAACSMVSIESLRGASPIDSSLTA